MSMDKQIALFKQILAETPSDVLDALIRKIDALDIAGPPAEEYFSEFDNNASSGFDDVFSQEFGTYQDELNVDLCVSYIDSVTALDCSDADITWYYTTISTLRTELSATYQTLFSPFFAMDLLEFSKESIEEELPLAA